MNILKKKKLSVKKVILTLVAILIALLVLISLFAGNYLVNYSIGRSGDGGNRTVALEIPETADDTERTIAEGKIAQQEANELAYQQNELAIEQNDLLNQQNTIAAKARRDANISSVVGAVQRHNTNKILQGKK